MRITPSLAQLHAAMAAPSVWVDAVRRVGGWAQAAIETEVRARRTCPCTWAAFHGLMLKSLPRWRWMARLWHKMMRRRMLAFCRVQEALER